VANLIAEDLGVELEPVPVTLPYLDGIQLCQRLRSHGYGLPVLMLSARDTDQSDNKNRTKSNAGS